MSTVHKEKEIGAFAYTSNVRKQADVASRARAAQRRNIAGLAGRHARNPTTRNHIAEVVGTASVLDTGMFD